MKINEDLMTAIGAASYEWYEKEQEIHRLLKTGKVLTQSIEMWIGNSILIKAAQICMLKAIRFAMVMANRAGYTAIFSHHSGETLLRILPLLWIRGRSKAAPSAAATVLPSTITYFAARRTLKSGYSMPIMQNPLI